MVDFAIIAVGLGVGVALAIYVVDAAKQMNLRTDP